MHKKQKKQNGFILIVALILLVSVTLLVLNGMRLANVGERMSGSSMDRGRAKMAAEQALTQGLALLQTAGTACLDGGCTYANLPGAAAEHTGNSLPASWSDTNASAATIASGQLSSAKFLINWLSDASFTPSPTKNSCKAYSIMGRGVGLNSASVVVLQTIAYICPAD
ncbi:pilus assembly PilX family protein [Undibacterium sp. Ren11W]|uniref:pilus assembly PilX family protein n=1 Tax=Undibacterium sp. Ren11W TaxID=3413045 RepID=UPI003BF4358E